MDDPRLDLLVSASLLGDAVDARVLHALRAAGCGDTRLGHGYVVQRLLAAPSSIGEIASALDVTQQAISKTVGELERGGYVERTPDERDARRRRVTLTERGWQMVEIARAARGDLLAEVERRVGPERLAVATETLHEALDAAGALTAARRRLARPVDGDVV
jgi:DNA-binding MarR family transcriptional regulator